MCLYTVRYAIFEKLELLVKNIITIMALLLTFGVSTAKPIEEKTAQKVASSFVKQSESTLNSNSRINLVYSYSNPKNSLSDSELDSPLYYVYSYGERGFIIVAGDDAAKPVLAFSEENSFVPDEMTNEVKFWLGEYAKQIEFAREENISANAKVAKEWETLLSGNGGLDISSLPEIVQPLVKAKWNQAPYYNDLCPYDETYQRRSVAGCVAIAMAQTMKYWNYPKIGQGFRTYSHNEYGLLSADFSDAEINWSSFPNVLNQTNEEMAYFIFMVGVSVDMHYSPHASGSYVISATSPQKHCSEYALETYWKYDPSTIRGVKRDGLSDFVWDSLLRSELQYGRPFIYAGFGEEGGHAWVCDGLRGDDFYSMNWGWGGSFNGFYALNALSPGSGGIGSGSGTFNERQEVLIGIQPISNNEPIMTLSGSLAFGDVSIGASKESVLYIHNIGDAPLEISSMNLPTDFEADWNSGTIQPNSTKMINVVFTPTSTKTVNTKVQFVSNITNGISEISITGKGKTVASSVEENNDMFRFYPNPSKDILIVETISNGFDNIKIFDSIGNIVYNSALDKSSELRISTEGFSTGVYRIILTGNGMSYGSNFTVVK